MLRKTSCTCDQFQRWVQLRGGWPRSTLCQPQKYKFKHFCPLALTVRVAKENKNQAQDRTMFHLHSKASTVVVGPSGPQVCPGRSNHDAHPSHAVAKRPCPLPRKDRLSSRGWSGDIGSHAYIEQNALTLRSNFIMFCKAAGLERET